MKQLFMFILVILVLAGTGCSQQNPGSQSAGQARLAPDFKLEKFDGKTVSLKDFKGKVLILDVWDTWCPPCRMEIPHFIELYEKYQAKGLVIFGAALGRDGREAVIAFNQKNKINYPGGFANEELLQAYGPISGIPTTFIIDQKGRIVRTYVGYRDKRVGENDIKTLLGIN
jgi:cytochrome c biogenesis protein CcmG, thiol:disulfide interchange protein DsbE